MTDIKNPDVIDFSDITDDQMNQMIDGTLTEFDEGDLVDGTIVKIERDEVLVDIGFKSEGVIPARELSIRKDADPSELVEVGDKIEALVLQKEDKDGRLILSKKRAEYERSWIAVEEKFKAGEPVTGEVIEVVKGGLIIDIGLRGFLPASLVDLRRVKDLDMYLGAREIDTNAFLDDLHEQARERAFQGLALDALAKELGLEATEDDVREEFVKAAVEDVDASIAEFRNDGRLSAIRESIRRTKAVQWLVENAIVTEVDEVAERRAAVQHAEELAAAKNAAKEAIDAAVPEGASDEVIAKANAAKEAIDNAETIEAVENAKTEGETAIKDQIAAEKAAAEDFAPGRGPAENHRRLHHALRAAAGARVWLRVRHPVAAPVRGDGGPGPRGAPHL